MRALLNERVIICVGLIAVASFFAARWSKLGWMIGENPRAVKKDGHVMLFDFDGTICDSHDAAIKAINKFAGKYKFSEIKQNEIENLKKISMKELLSKSGVSSLSVPTLVMDVQKELRPQISSLPIFVGISDVLGKLKEQGYILGVVTSNSEDNVKEFAHKHGLDFDFVFSDNTLFGKDRLIKNVLHSHSIAADRVTYIGDETRDVEAAKAVGIRSIAVTWGYNHRDLLEATHPDHVIETPAELLTIAAH